MPRPAFSVAVWCYSKVAERTNRVGYSVDGMSGNATYQEYMRRLPIAVPALDRAVVDHAIAGLGATPETVTEEQILRALRGTIYPLLAASGQSATVALGQAGLITTDAANRVLTITPAAATIVGIAPGVDVIGQPVGASPGLDGCVPLVESFTDAEIVRIAQCVIPADGRRVQCTSHLRTAA